MHWIDVLLSVTQSFLGESFYSVVQGDAFWNPSGNYSENKFGCDDLQSVV